MIIFVKAKKVSGKRQDFNKILKDGQSRAGEGWENSGLRRARNIPFSKIQLLWLLLHYGVTLDQPIGYHLQSVYGMPKLYHDFCFCWVILSHWTNSVLWLKLFVKNWQQWYMALTVLQRNLRGYLFPSSKWLGQVSSAHRGCSYSLSSVFLE